MLDLYAAVIAQHPTVRHRFPGKALVEASQVWFQAAAERWMDANTYAEAI